MNDFVTVFWKEMKDVVLQGGRTALLRPAILVVVFGVFLPLQAKGVWYRLPATILFTEIWGPLILSLAIVSDAFAGERERHTLESLLATPVSDRALLLGKMAVTVFYGMAVMTVNLALGIIVVNRSNAGGVLHFYPLGLLLGVLLLGLAVNTLGAAIGVFVSLRSSTVRQAQQIVTIGAVVMMFGGLAAVQSLAPHIHWSLTESQVLWLFAGVVTLLSAVFVSTALALFQRARLIVS